MSVTYTVECTVLPNTELLPFVTVHYQTKSGHGTIPNQTRQSVKFSSLHRKDGAREAEQENRKTKT